MKDSGWTSPLSVVVVYQKLSEDENEQADWREEGILAFVANCTIETGFKGEEGGTESSVSTEMDVAAACCGITPEIV